MRFAYRTEQKNKNSSFIHDHCTGKMIEHKRSGGITETVICCCDKVNSAIVIRRKTITNSKTPAEAALIFANFVNSCESEIADLPTPITPTVRAVNRQISIYCNGNWAGSGQLDRYGFICNCGVNWCDDTDKSMAVYDEIDQAIADGVERVVTYVSGEHQIITWLITGGDGRE